MLNLNFIFLSDLFLLSNELFIFFTTFIYIIYTNVIVSSYHNLYAVLLKNGYYILILIIFCYFILSKSNICNFEMGLYFNSFVVKNVLIEYIILFVLSMLILYFLFSIIEQQKYQLVNVEYIYVYISILYSLYIIAYSHDLLTLYLGIELLTISSYVLLFLQKYSVTLVEIGIKYFIWNSIISVLFLYCIHLIYTYYATIDIQKLYLLLTISNYENFKYEILCLFFFVFVITFKLGLVPFHIWMLEIYEGAFEKITLFFLIFPKLILFCLFIKNISILIEFDSTYWKQICLFNIIITAFYTSILVLKKTKLKSILIYFSLLSSGLLYLDILTLSIESITSSYIYLIVYCIHIYLFFFLKQSINLVHKKEHAFNIYFLNKLYIVQPWIALSILILFFSLLGIPPFSGFFSKLYLLYGVFIWNDYFNLFLILITSLISSFLYLYIIKNIYLNSLKQFIFLLPIANMSSYLISISVFFICIIFINISNFFLLVNKLLLCYYI